MTTKFQELIKLKNDFDAKLQLFGKDAIAEIFAPLFAGNRTIDGVCWSQYTPYFNDGEPCIFSVNDPQIIVTLPSAIKLSPDADFSKYTTVAPTKPIPELNPSELRDLADALEADVGLLPAYEDFGYGNPRCFDSWEVRTTKYNFDTTGFRKMWDQIPEEIFQSVFGDHVDVRIMRDGQIEIDECSHE